MSKLQDAEVVIIMLRQDLACCTEDLRKSRALTAFYRKQVLAMAHQIVEDTKKRDEVSEEYADWFYPMGG